MDENKKLYAIQNADNNVKSLKKGDIFRLEYGKIGLIIAKVKDITVDGDTVMIAGDDMEMSDALQMVKINYEGDTTDVVYYDDAEIIKDYLLSDNTDCELLSTYNDFSENVKPFDDHTGFESAELRDNDIDEIENGPEIGIYFGLNFSTTNDDYLVNNKFEPKIAFSMTYDEEINVGKAGTFKATQFGVDVTKFAQYKNTVEKNVKTSKIQKI